jgi:ribose transport system permease protein
MSTSETSVHAQSASARWSMLLARLKDRETLVTLAPVLGLLAITIIFTVANPRFLSKPNLINILRQSSILFVLVVGQTFVILSGALDLSVEGAMALSGIIAALLVVNDRNANDFGLLAVLLAVSAGVLMGLANGLIHVKARIPSFMVTLGTWFIGLGLAVLIFQGRNFLIRDEAFLALYQGRVAGFPIPVIIAVAVVAAGWFLERFTRFGRHTYAIGGGEDLSRMSGINVGRHKILLFAVAGLFFGIGGVLSSARLAQGTGLIGSYLFPTVSAVVVGGTSISGGAGGILRSVIGVLFVVSVGNGMVMMGLHPFAQWAIQGMVFVAAVFFTLDRSKVPLLK